MPGRLGAKKAVSLDGCGEALPDLFRQFEIKNKIYYQRHKSEEILVYTLVFFCSP